jgi:chitinase
VLTGYWQNFYNGAKALRLSDVPASYNIIAVSFADADASKPGGVTFTLDPGLSSQLGGYTDAQFKADIKTLQGRGQQVIISVGGQNGTISVGDSTSSANFANSVGTLMQQYGFNGVDIDLENGINANYMGSALRSIYAKGGTVITMAPQTIDMQSTSAGYFQLALGIKDILTIVNMQYYNSGSMNGCDGQVYSQGSVNFLTALACIQLRGGLRGDQVGLGLPASPSGAGSGYVSPSIVNSALDCLAKGTGCGSFKPSATYPSIRGAMTWSINWDASNGYAFANAVGGHLATLP